MTDPDDHGASSGSGPTIPARSRLADWTRPPAEQDEEARRSPAAVRRENQHLREALASQPVIDQAKGALMLRYRLDADSAFGLMVRWSQAANIKVRDIAEALVDSIVTGDLGHVDVVLAREIEQVLQPHRGEPRS